MADKFLIRLFQPIAAVSTDAVLQFARTKNGTATRNLLADLDDAGLFRATSFGVYGGSNGTDFTGVIGSLTVDKGIVTAASAGVQPPFLDTNSLIKGSSDASKLLRFEVDGFSASTTRVLTPLNKDYTIEETAHQSKHNSGGSDALQLDNLAAPDDNTDLNASTSKHGLLPKLDNNSAHFLDGTGNWTNPAASATWTNTINESGTSLSNWFQTSGSWSVVSSAFHIDTGATTVRQLSYSTAVAQSAIIFQADVQMVSTGGFAADNRVGLIINTGGTVGTPGSLITLRSTGALTPASTGKIYCEGPAGVTSGPTSAFNFSLDTFYTLKVVAIGPVMDVYVDGVFKFSFFHLPYVQTTTAFNPGIVGMYAYNCRADFKNIKMYALTLP